MALPTLQEEFDGFIQASYDDPLSPDHLQQLKDAFYGGAMVAYANTTNFMPELISHSRDAILRAAGGN